MQWMNEPTCTPAESTDTSPVFDFARPFIGRREHGVHRVACLHLPQSKNKKQGDVFFFLVNKTTKTKKTKQCSGTVEMCLGEPAGWQILAADVQVNSLWVNQLLMHAVDSQTGAAHTASLPSISTRIPHNKRWPFIWNGMWQPCVISPECGGADSDAHGPARFLSAGIDVALMKCLALHPRKRQVCQHM